MDQNQARRLLLIAAIVLISTLRALPGMAREKTDTLPHPSVSFTFTLSNTARTSAGVYTGDSVLIRTLWSAVTYNAGTHTAEWDGVRDDGTLAADGNYYVRVLSNNMQYAWEGTIGNNSDADTGRTVQRGYAQIIAMAIAGSYAYYAKGYSEGNPSQLKLNLATPGSRIQIQPPGENTGQETFYTATDGTSVYWAGRDPFAQTLYFVFATQNSNDAEVPFPYGKSIKAVRGRTYKWSIDSVNSTTSAITGMAVQRSGKYLFIAHAQMNKLHVLNKTTGQLVQALTYTAPGALATDTANNLWLAHNGTIEKFTVDTATGILTTTGITLSGVLSPLALGVSQNNQLIVAADGATASQQLKAFNNLTGAASWTFGQAGGYANGPDVTDDKFYFADVRSTMKTFVAFEADGSFWVGDPGNSRAQHYSASRTLINRIMYQPHFYSCRVDYNDPTRVFADFREFHIDYSKPIARTNGSWELVKNWGYNVPATWTQQYNILSNVNTLSNGRTYALLFSDSAQKWQVVELPATGNIRLTGMILAADNSQLYPDGSLRRMTRLQLNQPTVWTKRSLTGFDASGNPQWATAVNVAKTPPATNSDPGYWGDGKKLRSGEVTSSGIAIAFDGQGYHAGFDNYHLGGVKVGDSTWKWRVAPSTRRDYYTGPFPTDGTYDISNNVEYSGVAAMAVDRNIFWGYHGEFWKNSQTNKWHQVYDDGLFIGQFGVTGPEVAGKEAPIGMAGNAFSANAIKIGDTVYLYHNDEGHHGGIHRWRITGFNTIQEQTDTINFSMSGKHGLLATYHNGIDLNTLRRTISRIDSTVHIDFTDAGLADTTSFSTIWSGYLEPQYSEKYIFYAAANKGVRLWLNDSLMINKRDTVNIGGEYKDSLIVKAGQRYAVRMEVMHQGTGSVARLSWSSAHQAKQQIPYNRLYPDEASDYAGGYDLLEHLRYRGILEDSLYGWSRSLDEDYFDPLRKYFTAKTNVKTNAKTGRDLYIKFRYNTANTGTVIRDLGDVTSSVWNVSGVLNYEQNVPNEDADISPNGKGGQFLEVLDDQNKVIVRFFWNMIYSTKITTLYANSKIIVQKHVDSLKGTFSVPQPFSISMDGDSATVQYASFAPVKVAPLEATAHKNKPSKVRFYFWYKNFNSDRIIDISKLKFATGSMSPFMMKAPAEKQKPVLEKETRKLLLFPNPSTGMFFFMKLSDPSPYARVRVTDMTGRTVFSQTLANGGGSIGVQLDRKLPAGIYIVTVNERHSEKLLVY